MQRKAIDSLNTRCARNSGKGMTFNAPSSPLADPAQAGFYTTGKRSSARKPGQVEKYAGSLLG